MLAHLLEPPQKRGQPPQRTGAGGHGLCGQPLSHWGTFCAPLRLQLVAKAYFLPILRRKRSARDFFDPIIYEVRALGHGATLHDLASAKINRRDSAKLG